MNSKQQLRFIESTFLFLCEVHFQTLYVYVHIIYNNINTDTGANFTFEQR